jgi:hypothetical protein
MSRYDWVDHIVVLHTEKQDPKLSVDSDKVIEYWGDFGWDFDHPPQIGGFNEIAARNCCIHLAEQYHPEWLLQCDADELYSEDTQELLKCHDDLVWLACYPMVSPSSYAVVPLHPVLKLMDPHPRLFRPGMRFIQNYDIVGQCPNLTAHCVLDSDGVSKQKVSNPNVVYHMHLKFVLNGWTVPQTVDIGRIMFEWPIGG